MRFTHPPFWFWRLDRWKLLAALLLALLALLMALRGCGAPQVQAPEIALPDVQLPKITLPSVAGMRAGEPIDLDGTAAPGAKVQISEGLRRQRSAPGAVSRLESHRRQAATRPDLRCCRRDYPVR